MKHVDLEIGERALPNGMTLLAGRNPAVATFAAGLTLRVDIRNEREGEWGLANLVGADRVLFGSDFPHPEGVADPLCFVDDMTRLDAEEVRAVMRENCLGLMQRQPVSGG